MDLPNNHGARRARDHDRVFDDFLCGRRRIPVLTKGRASGARTPLERTCFSARMFRPRTLYRSLKRDPVICSRIRSDDSLTNVPMGVVKSHFILAVKPRHEAGRR